VASGRSRSMNTQKMPWNLPSDRSISEIQRLDDFDSFLDNMPSCLEKVATDSVLVVTVDMPSCFQYTLIITNV